MYSRKRHKNFRPIGRVDFATKRRKISYLTDFEPVLGCFRLSRALIYHSKIEFGGSKMTFRKSFGKCSEMVEGAEKGFKRVVLAPKGPVRGSTGPGR